MRNPYGTRNSKKDTASQKIDSPPMDDSKETVSRLMMPDAAKRIRSRRPSTLLSFAFSRTVSDPGWVAFDAVIGASAIGRVIRPGPSVPRAYSAVAGNVKGFYLLLLLARSSPGLGELLQLT